MARQTDLSGATLLCQAFFNAAIGRIVGRPVESEVRFLDDGGCIVVKVLGCELVQSIPPGMSVSETMELMVGPLAAMVVAGGPTSCERSEPTGSLPTGAGALETQLPDGQPLGS